MVLRSRARKERVRDERTITRTVFAGIADVVPFANANANANADSDSDSDSDTDADADADTYGLPRRSDLQRWHQEHGDR